MVLKFSHKDVDKLCQHLGDDLSVEKCEEIKREVDNCPDCNVILNEIKGTIELYRKALPQKSVPDSVINRLKIILQLPE